MLKPCKMQQPWEPIWAFHGRVTSGRTMPWMKAHLPSFETGQSDHPARLAVQCGQLHPAGLRPAELLQWTPPCLGCLCLSESARQVTEVEPIKFAAEWHWVGCRLTGLSLQLSFLCPILLPSPSFPTEGTLSLVPILCFWGARAVVPSNWCVAGVRWSVFHLTLRSFPLILYQSFILSTGIMFSILHLRVVKVREKSPN